MKNILSFTFLVVCVYGSVEYFNINPFNKSIHVDLNVAFKLDENQIKKKFQKLQFDCANENGNLGDRVCWASVSSFNGFPADMIAFFFEAGEHRFIRVSTDRKNHNDLKSYADKNFEYVGLSPRSENEVGQGLGVWLSNVGRITSTIDSPPLGEQSILLWEKI